MTLRQWRRICLQALHQTVEICKIPPDTLTTFYERSDKFSPCYITFKLSLEKTRILKVDKYEGEHGKESNDCQEFQECHCFFAHPVIDLKPVILSLL
jgi:hypothetical protein